MNASINLNRSPRETAARMGDLATLPVFLKLKGKTALVAGGSAGTAWKAELLAAAGAHVRLVWDTPDAEAIKLAHDWPERVTLLERALEDRDFTGAAIAIGALEDDHEAAAFAAKARSLGIPVNVVDKPAFCDFQFGAIVNRSPLVIGISTDGGAPPLGQAVRSMIETLLPAGFAGWAAAAKAWRSRVVLPWRCGVPLSRHALSSARHLSRSWNAPRSRCVLAIWRLWVQGLAIQNY
jgi:uroporphyrin-III C-methyltransferase / precorrin-2 dehydrogenase / sirohydrochlorin ferrochelatase